MLTIAPKGTKDILPNQVHKWHYVEKTFVEICKKYGFSEIRTPTFEHSELFLRGVGDTTDIVERQLYTFKDYADRSLTLKPEGTSPVARAFVEHKQYAEVQPTRYYYNIPCFRYEKPQSGRLREFHQLGTEIFCTTNMLADAEVICLAKDFIDALGLQDIELKINSIGCSSCREKYKKALQEYLAPQQNWLCDTCKERFETNPIRILDCKSEVCGEIAKGAPVIGDFICDECKEDFEVLKQYLTNMEIPFTVDSKIVRGLDYYTKTAFEFVSSHIGARGTICGGGRYDHLIECIGGPPIPGVGFGLGIERLLIALEANDIEIKTSEPMEVFIAAIGDEPRAYAMKIMRRLRKLGIKTEMDMLTRNLKGQMKYAGRIKAKHALIIGTDEMAIGKALMRNMATSEQQAFSLENLTEQIISYLENTRG